MTDCHPLRKSTKSKVADKVEKVGEVAGIRKIESRKSRVESCQKVEKSRVESALLFLLVRVGRVDNRIVGNVSLLYLLCVIVGVVRVVRCKHHLLLILITKVVLTEEYS